MKAISRRKMKKTSQTGFAHLGSLLLVLVLVVIAFAGYKVAQNHNSKVKNSTSTAANTEQVQTIKSASDLDKAQTTLDNTNVDGDLNPDSMDQDVQSLL
jgi:uncharacterized protein (UPF0333 family)